MLCTGTCLRQHQLLQAASIQELLDDDRASRFLKARLCLGSFLAHANECHYVRVVQLPEQLRLCHKGLELARVRHHVRVYALDSHLARMSATIFWRKFAKGHCTSTHRLFPQRLQEHMCNS